MAGTELEAAALHPGGESEAARRRLEEALLLEAKAAARSAKAGPGAKTGSGAARHGKAASRANGTAAATSAVRWEPGALEEDGPFSDAWVEQSWGGDVARGVIRHVQHRAADENLDRWIREHVSGDPVSEVELTEQEKREFGAMRGSGSQHLQVPGAYDRLPSPRGKGDPTRRSNSRPEAPPARSPAVRGGQDGDAMDLEEPRVEEAFNPLEAIRQARQQVANLATLAQALLPPAEPINSRLYGAAEASNSRRDDSPPPQVVSVTVALKRADTQRKWGLAWVLKGFKERQERVVDRIEPNSVVQQWNVQQEQAGHPERAIRPHDRLVAANGKTRSDEIKHELTGQEVVLEFHRQVRLRGHSGAGPGFVPSPRQDSPAAPPAAAAAVPGQAASPPPPKRRAFQHAFAEYLKASGVPDGEEGAAPSADAADDKAEEQQEQQAADDAVFAWPSPGQEVRTAELAGAAPAADDEAAAPADVGGGGGGEPATASDAPAAGVSPEREAGAPVRPARTRTTVASALTAYLAAAQSAPSGPAAATPEPAATAGSPAPSLDSSPQSREPPLVMGPFASPPPRARAWHFVEKDDLLEKLRARRAGGNTSQESPNIHRGQSTSFDSDDEHTLARLSAALGTLERSAARTGEDE